MPHASDVSICGLDKVESLFEIDASALERQEKNLMQDRVVVLSFNAFPRSYDLDGSDRLAALGLRKGKGKGKPLPEGMIKLGKTNADADGGETGADGKTAAADAASGSTLHGPLPPAGAKGNTSTNGARRQRKASGYWSFEPRSTKIDSDLIEELNKTAKRLAIAQMTHTFTNVSHEARATRVSQGHMPSLGLNSEDVYEDNGRSRLAYTRFNHAPVTHRSRLTRSALNDDIDAATVATEDDEDASFVLMPADRTMRERLQLPRPNMERPWKPGYKHDVFKDIKELTDVLDDQSRWMDKMNNHVETIVDSLQERIMDHRNRFDDDDDSGGNAFRSVFLTRKKVPAALKAFSLKR